MAVFEEAQWTTETAAPNIILQQEKPKVSSWNLTPKCANM